MKKNKAYRGNLSNKLDMYRLYELTGLHPPDNYIEYNMYSYVYEDAIKNGSTEEEAEAAAAEAEQREYDEYFRKHSDGVVKAARMLFEAHDMSLKEFDGNYYFEPNRSWKASLKEVIKTINGVGYFTFGSVKELCYSGPYTVYEALITHLHWMKDYPEVYGTDSCARILERHMR